MRLSYPLKGNYPVTGTFGWRGSFQLPDGRWTDPIHWGIDWGAPAGTPIYAAHDGTVTWSGWDHSYYGGGWQIQITNGEYATWYLHMQAQSPVSVGTRVKRGQLIGYVGSTGASTGPHLHLELHVNGTPVDPAPYFQQQDTSPGHDYPPYIHPIIEEDGEDEEMKLWIADVKGTWYLVVPTGSGKPNTVVLPGNSGMGGGGAARAGIPVIRLTTVTELRKVANA